MDRQTLNEYKFMDTPEFKKDSKKMTQPTKFYQWLLNNFIRGDN